MPASDPGPARQDAQKSRMRAYFISMLAAAGLCVMAVVALNVLVDPLGLLGIRHAIWSDRIMAKWGTATRRLVEDVYLASIDNDASIYLVGSSRYQLGFNVCGLPDIRKVAIPAADLSDIVHAQDTLLRAARDPKTLVLEVNGARLPAHPFTGPSALQLAVQKARLLFSYDVTRASFGYLTAGGHTSLEAAAPDCAANNNPLPDRSTSRRLTIIDGAKALENTARYDRAWFRQALLDAERICHEQGVRHKIRWLMLPMTWEEENPVMAKTIMQWRQAIAAALAGPRPYRGACDIAIVDYAPAPDTPQGRAWRDRSRWRDYIHFGAGLGDTGLRAVHDALLAANGSPTGPDPRQNRP